MTNRVALSGLPETAVVRIGCPQGDKDVRHLQRELMTEHRMLAPDVFLTAYGDGSRTVCNYADKTYVYAGTPVRSMSYILVNPNGSVFQP